LTQLAQQLRYMTGTHLNSENRTLYDDLMVGHIIINALTPFHPSIYLSIHPSIFDI